MFNNNDKEIVEIRDKILMTIQECSKISNIGENKLYEITQNPKCPFVLYVGKKRLIKRKEFEKFISENIEI